MTRMSFTVRVMWAALQRVLAAVKEFTELAHLRYGRVQPGEQWTVTMQLSFGRKLEPHVSVATGKVIENEAA